MDRLRLDHSGAYLGPIEVGMRFRSTRMARDMDFEVVKTTPDIHSDAGGDVVTFKIAKDGFPGTMEVRELYFRAEYMPPLTDEEKAAIATRRAQEVAHQWTISPVPWESVSFVETDIEIRDANGTTLISGDIIDGTKSDIRAMSLAPELLAMLRKLEWSGITTDGTSEEVGDGSRVYSSINACPICNGDRTGHRPYCALAALLARVDGIGA